MPCAEGGRGKVSALVTTRLGHPGPGVRGQEKTSRHFLFIRLTLAYLEAEAAVVEVARGAAMPGAAPAAAFLRSQAWMRYDFRSHRFSHRLEGDMTPSLRGAYARVCGKRVGSEPRPTQTDPSCGAFLPILPLGNANFTAIHRPRWLNASQAHLTQRRSEKASQRAQASINSR